MALGDYAITNEAVGMAPESIAKIRGHEMIEHLSTTKLSVYAQDENGEYPIELGFALPSWETFQVAGLDDTRLSSYIDGLSEQDKSDLLSGAACIVKNPIPFAYEGQAVEATDFGYGDILSVDGYEVRVVGIADFSVSINNDGFINGVQIIVNDKMYDLLTGSHYYSEIYPALKQDADNEQFETWLDNWCQENPGSHWLSYLQTAAQLEESFQQIKMLCWGLILFIGLIGILNIINTVYKLPESINEIAVTKAFLNRAGLSKSVGDTDHPQTDRRAYEKMRANVTR